MLCVRTLCAHSAQRERGELEGAGVGKGGVSRVEYQSFSGRAASRSTATALKYTPKRGCGDTDTYSPKYQNHNVKRGVRLSIDAACRIFW